MTSPTPSTGPPTTNFFKLDKRLQSLETKIVYIGVPDKTNNNRRPYWELWGAHAGEQGLSLAPGVVGLMHTPFTQLVSEGPYQLGATYERVEYAKREIQIAVMIGIGDPDTIFRYRMIEQRWWSSWSAKEDGYLGVFTRTHGWRWLKVRLATDPKTVMTLDPQAMDNNFMQWDLTAVAAQPYWCKRQETATWSNTSEGPPPATPWDELEELVEDILAGLFPNISKLIPGLHVGEGNIVVPNRGDQPVFPKFLVSSPGRAWIEDGPGGEMVELPLSTPADGTLLIDTDPTARTITSATDPVDPLFYRIARNSELLQFFLHDITSFGLPVWRRFNGRFTTPWPAKTVNRIKVRHSNAGGTITCLMPQKYGMAYG